MSLRYTLLSALVICFIHLPAQAVRYVATYGWSGGGSSWGNPCNDLQAMINASSPGDEVWVRYGTYSPSQDPFGSTSPADPRDKTFYLKDGVKVYGGFAGSESALSQRSATGNVTTLSGIASDCYHVILSVADGPTTVLERFTITGGNANGGGTITVETYGITRNGGGGMQNHASSPTIENCTFTSNTAADRAGGIYNNAGSNPAFNAVTISSNTGNYGGGMLNDASSPVLTGCTFTLNSANVNGGGIYSLGLSVPVLTNCTISQNYATVFNSLGNGGGMFNDNARPTLTNCSFTSNRARNNGGGMANTNSADATLTGCTFSGNTTNNPSFVLGTNIYVGGGAMWNNSSSPTISRCVFIGNTTHCNGGAIRNRNAYPVITNSVFISNSASGYGGAMINLNSGPAITNCDIVSNGAGQTGGGFWNDPGVVLTNSIVWGNYGGGTNGVHGSITATYSIIQGGISGTGNSSSDPLFANTADADGPDNIWGNADDGLFIQYSSPARNGGDPTTTTPPADITGATRVGTFDMGAYEYNTCTMLQQGGGKIYVSATGAGDGTSWANATNDLQAAIDNTCGATEIWVRAGTYTPAAYPTGCTTCATSRDYAFAPKAGVSLYGGFAGTETALSQRDVAANASILSGDIGTPNDITDNCHHVVICAFNSTSTTTRLDGFTITGGNGNGSGSIMVNGLPIIRFFGGGIYTYSGTNIFANNTFTANSTTAVGGGVYIESGINTLTNNTLFANSAPYGAGVYTYSGTNTLSNNVFSANAATVNGGGVCTNYGSNALVNNTFSANSAANSGGGVSTVDGTNTFTNNIFWGNQQGGSSTVSGADYQADGVNGNTFTNNLLQLAEVNYPATTAAPYGIGAAATGNLFAQDPLFVNAADIDGADNLHRTADDGLALTNNSPAKNASDPATTSPTTDITGYTRSGQFDQGAYEISPCVAAGSKLYVTPAGTGRGDSWGNATADLTGAINNRCGSTEIWVAAGTYLPIEDHTRSLSPADPRTKTFLLKSGVALYGGFAGTETTLSQRDLVTNISTLSGDIGTSGNSADNCYHVVISVSDNSATVLDGFTITGGKADVGSLISVEGKTVALNSGGGMVCETASPTIANCIVSGNAAGDRAGGLYCHAGANPQVTNVVFTGNTGGYGGAMLNDASAPSLTNCVFAGNTSTVNGGAIYNLSSNIAIVNSTFVGNSGNNAGGAMFNDASTPTVANSLIWSNVSPNTPSIWGAATVSYSVVQYGYAGATDSDPQFSDIADPDGADNRWRTADDGLIPANGGLAINASNPVTSTPITDVRGATRVGIFELGAYENTSPCAIFGPRLYVNPLGSGSGASWSDAVGSLYAAMTNTCADEIWVAAGTYLPVADAFDNVSPTDPRTKTFMLRSGHKLYGGFAGTETSISQRNIAINQTILSGDIETSGSNADNCYHVVLAINTNAATLLDGFTIRDGNADNGAQEQVQSRDVWHSLGAGIYATFSALSVSNCTFLGHGSYYGGAAYVRNSNGTFDKCIFENNVANVNGGAVNCDQSPFNFKNCVFSNNSTSHTGGALFLSYTTTSLIESCVFYNNSATSATLGGGAIFSSGANVTIRQTTFVENSTNLDGGAIHSRNNATTTLINSIFHNNTAGGSGPMIINTNGATSSMNYCRIQDPASGTNIDGNPQFVDAADPDGADNQWLTADDGLVLSLASPAINAGDPAATLPATDILGAAHLNIFDMGAYENTNPCWNIGTRLYVKTTGTGTGGSWAQATNDLQTAINNACGVAEIWVAAGTYYPTQDPYGVTSPADARNKTFMLQNGIQVYGGFAGTETALSQRNVAENQTVLSGDLGTAGNIVDNSYHVLISVLDGNTTTLDGFTISGGYCNGGGTPSIEGKPVYQFRGGGMYNVSSNINIANCVFINNQTSTDRGGAMNCEDGAAPAMDNCVFSSNTAGFGGAIFCENSSPEIRNSLFSGNTASYGGAMFNFISGNPKINNCTFFNNVSNINGQVFYIDAGAISTLNNSILWGNTGAGAPVVGPATIANSLVQGGYTGTNILDSNPLFVNAADPNGADNLWLTDDDGLRLACGSPAINAGTNTGVTATTDATGAPRTRFTTTDMGAYESLMATLTAPQAVAGASLTRTADAECTDQSGWTHYYASATNDVLLSVYKNGNDIGTVGDGTFVVTSNTTPNWGSNTGTTISAPYVDNPQWFIMNRWWNVTATHQPTSDVSVRTYYTAQDLADVNGSLGSNAITAAQMRFYKINGGDASLTVATPHDGIGIASAYNAVGYWDYTPGPVASTTQWSMGTNPDGATYAEYVIASFSGGGGGGGAGGAGAFPVEWLDFTATQTQGNGTLAANLQWITGVEANVAAFEIERSIGEPGMAWVNIGTAQPSNTSGPHAYTFTDTELGALAVATVYYRIRSVDADGSVSHSNIATLSVQNGMQLEVYPTPVQHQLSIQLFASSPTSIQPQFILYDLTGRIILEKRLQATLNHIDTQGLSQGVYPWRIITDGKVYTGTVVKE